MVGPRWPGASRGQHCLAVARIGDTVMNDVAKKMRTGEAPLPARCIGAQLPQALARGNEQRCAARPRDIDLRHVVLPTPGLPKLRLRLGSDKTPSRDSSRIYPLQSTSVVVMPRRVRAIAPEKNMTIKVGDRLPPAP